MAYLDKILRKLTGITERQLKMFHLKPRRIGCIGLGALDALDGFEKNYPNAEIMVFSRSNDLRQPFDLLFANLIEFRAVQADTFFRDCAEYLTEDGVMLITAFSNKACLDIDKNSAEQMLTAEDIHKFLKNSPRWHYHAITRKLKFFPNILSGVEITFFYLGIQRNENYDFILDRNKELSLEKHSGSMILDSSEKTNEKKESEPPEMEEDEAEEAESEVEQSEAEESESEAPESEEDEAEENESEEADEVESEEAHEAEESEEEHETEEEEEEDEEDDTEESESESEKSDIAEREVKELEKNNEHVTEHKVIERAEKTVLGLARGRDKKQNEKTPEAQAPAATELNTLAKTLVQHNQRCKQYHDSMTEIIEALKNPNLPKPEQNNLYQSLQKTHQQHSELLNQYAEMQQKHKTVLNNFITEQQQILSRQPQQIKQYHALVEKHQKLQAEHADNTNIHQENYQKFESLIPTLRPR